MTAAVGVECVAERLGRLGFKKRAGLVFTLPLDGDDVLGWVGLNKASRHSQGEVLLSPIVGVRHQGIERVVAQLRGEKFHAYLPPTVSSPLRYVMPVDEPREWVVKGEISDEAVADHLAAAVECYGFEFMRSCAGSADLIAALRADHGHAHQNAYRLPVALLSTGAVADARRVVESEVEALGDRFDPAAAELREFASRLRQRITAAGRP
jgi:hypothetical protein